MYREQILDYYSRKDIQKAILELSENREVVPTLASGNFGTRPNAVFYEKDVEQLVKQGAVSFHCSVERWKNPLELKTEMRTQELNELRAGWDLILDIDCYRGLDAAKKAAQVMINALEQYDITSYGIKFSGNRGFHIGVPFECFPEEIMYVGNIEKDFPRIPKIIIEYLKDFTRKDLKQIFNENPDKVISLDSNIITSRHLFRMPYALHNKTWLASVPLKKDELENFEREQAKIENVEIGKKFLDFLNAKENEATELLQSAIYWNSRKGAEKKIISLEEFKLPERAVGAEYFPPCIGNILQGLEDGRKRSIFVLTTFLHNIGWAKNDIEKFLLAWNLKNKPPLRDSLVKLTFNNQFSRKRLQMSPSCNNINYYKGYGVCMPDGFCKTIRNPVTYSLRKFRGAQPAAKKKVFRKRRVRQKPDLLELSKR